MPLNYRYIDIPVNTQAGIPNPNNYSSEAIWYQYLQFIVATDGVARTDTGISIFDSPSSGIKYNTNDPKWKGMANIFNRGQEGMMNLLHYLYSSPTNGKGWIATSSSINTLALQVDKIEDGRIIVENANNLDGHDSTYFATKAEFDLAIAQIKSGVIIAGNADNLDGRDSTYFATKTYADSINLKVDNIINGTTKVPKATLADRALNADNAGNADNLDGHDSTYFQVASTAFTSYGGTGVPSSSLGKNGDIYVMYA